MYTRINMAKHNQGKWMRRFWMVMLLFAGLGMILFLIAPAFY